MRESIKSLPRLTKRYGTEAVEAQLNALARHGRSVEDAELWLEAALAGDFKFIPLAIVGRCPCGSSNSTLLRRFVFWNLLGLRECDQCGLLIVSPRLTMEAMRATFDEQYFDYSDLHFWGERRVRVFADALRILKLSKSEKVFDVGAAFGHFVKYVQENGLEAAGSDISAKAVEAGRANLGVELLVGSLKELMLPDASVDAVVSLDAFYYVADLRAELEAMRRLVKPRGMLVLRLRNCLWARIHARAPRIRKIARSVLPAQHLWGFTPESISTLLTNSGWGDVECQPAAYSMSRFGGAQSAAVWANRLARRIWQGIPIFTRSFNVIAKRTD